MKYTVNQTMRKKKIIRTSKTKNKMILAAVWMDDELRDNIKLRSHYSKYWNTAKKNKDPPERIDEYKKKYLIQKRITKTMCIGKKSQWEEKKIKETWNDGKNSGR